MLTLAQLIAPRTKAAILASRLLALQGVGRVRHAGTGLSAVSASGVAAVTASVVIEVLVGGERGSATFRYSLDGGVTWSASAIVPSAGSYVLGATGATLSFGAGTYVAGDRYAVALAVPTFPVAAWQQGSVPLTLIENDAQTLEDLELLVSRIASGGFLDYAEGDWLDLLADSFYDLQRIQAKFTRGTATLTALATSGPHTIVAGDLWALAANGKRFVNVTGGTLLAGGTLELEWQAESPGAAWNVSAGTITALSTPLPGVSVSNAAGTPTAWITQFGDDKELDANLRARCKGRWSELGIASTETYETWARAAATGNRKVTCVEDPNVPGRVLVYVAPEIGGTANAAAAQEYIDERAPLTSTAVVAEAGNVVVAITGIAYVRAGYKDSAKSAAIIALTALFNATPIGGFDVGAGGRMSCEQIAGYIATQPGMVNIALTEPSTDVVLTSSQNASFDPALPGLTWVEV